MKNKEVADAFLDGESAITKNMFSEVKDGVCVVYSYGYHFPIAIKLLDGHFIVNECGYSSSTQVQKTYVARVLGYDNFKDLEANHDKTKITLKDTDYILKVLSDGVKTHLELIEVEI